MSRPGRILAMLGLELFCLLVIGYVSLPHAQADAVLAETPLDSWSFIIVYTNPQPDTNANSEVWTISPDGLNPIQLTTHIGDDRHPAISPDGSRIAYVSRADNQSTTLWVMSRDGSNASQMPVGGNTQRLTWSPTGSQLAITNDAVDWWEIWLVKPDGTDLHRLTTTSAAAGSPSWSPDEQTIVYTVNPAIGYVDLYLINSDGTGQTLFVSASGTGFSHQMPSWSPDGTQIASIRWSAGSAGPYELWLMNADGTNGRALVQDVDQPHLNRISWSPDGSWLIFSKSGQIWRVHRDGSQLTQITTAGGSEPSIGPRLTACVAQAHESDIALVVDRSGSMSANNKLDNAKLALTMFISMTQAPPDQIALVSFSSAAALNQPLTIDKPALISATQALTPVGSTRIDLGLAEARTELASPRHISTHAKIIVLLTDGQQNPAGNDPVIAQANAAKAEGAIIYTIGLGTDVDAALLQQIATSLDHYYYAPTSADLEHIYQQISASIVCPDIGGTVYVDQDHNGQYAPGIDTPLSDIAVQLDGPVDSQTVSQADGRYAFVDNVSGIYTVSLVVSSIPTGYLPISPTFHVINLTSLDSLDNNFGVRAGTEMAIVFTRPQPETSSNSEIWIMAADGTNQTQLTAYAGEDRWPNLSPDRTKVVYSSYRDDRWTLWIMNSDGTNPVQLPVTGNSMAATWSPDGTRIAFTNDTEDWWETWVIDADGSHLSRLTTHGPAAGHPSWSPDGTKIIYGVEPSPMYFDLYAVNSDGSGGQALITSSAGTGFSNHFPAWAPDNTLVAVEHWAAGTYGPRELWTMNPDGSGGMSLVNDIEDNEQQLSWTRDGNWLVYSKDGQIWRVRRDGSQLTQITTSGGWEPHTSANKYISYIYLPVIENH